MALKQVHGPYRVLFGFHSEDVPSLGPDREPLVFKVKAVTQQEIETAGGQKIPIVEMGVKLRWLGRIHTAYVGGQKVAASDVKPGDELALAHEQTYGPSSVPERLRPKGMPDCIYAAFMSSSPLDAMFNGPGREFAKYVKVPNPANQLAEARKKVEELEAQLVEKKPASVKK